MAAISSIEWTEATWNPVTGCTRVSTGCDHCYAVALTKRLAAIGQPKYQGLINDGKQHFNGIVKTHPNALSIPLHRKKPTLYFVNSMSDLFHKEVSFEFIQSVFETMEKTPLHTYQILTKRPERMAEVVPKLTLLDGSRFADKPLLNVWLGTSVESQEVAPQRIPFLQETPASVRFLSCEPLLGELDLREYLNHCHVDHAGKEIHWVIVGGESGPKAREMKKAWVQDIQTQCADNAVAFFFKQWGGVRKKKTGRLLDGKTYDEMPKRVYLTA